VPVYDGMWQALRESKSSQYAEFFVIIRTKTGFEVRLVADIVRIYTRHPSVFSETSICPHAKVWLLW